MEREASPYALIENILEGVKRVGEHAERKHREHGRKRPAQRQPIADPTISGCAASLADEAWEEINKRRMSGEPWHQARQRVLTHSVRGWQKVYGKEASQEAFNDVMCRHPKHDAPDALHDLEREEFQRFLIESRAKVGRPIKGFNLWWLRTFGIPLW